MTLPSGQISIANINTEIGRSASYSEDLNFLNGLIRSDQRPASPNFNSFKDKAYYQRNQDGNCNNTNCASGASSGNKQCVNCSLTAINCANCDTQNWLQANCNCACTYNCDQHTDQGFNCNCDCSLVCACACSDPQLKNEISVIDGALDKVNQLTGYYYNWNQRAGSYGKLPGKRTMGVMADRTQQVVPEVVGDYQDVLTVDYDALTALLIEAVKELNVQVNDLKSRNIK